MDPCTVYQQQIVWLKVQVWSSSSLVLVHVLSSQLGIDLVYRARPSYAAAIMRFPAHAGRGGSSTGHCKNAINYWRSLS